MGEVFSYPLRCDSLSKAIMAFPLPPYALRPRFQLGGCFADKLTQAKLTHTRRVYIQELIGMGVCLPPKREGATVKRSGVDMSNRQLFSIGLVLVAYSTATISSAAEQNKPEAVEIPLNKIWGYNMPGTRDLEKVEGRLTAKQWEGIRRALSTPPPQGKEARTGFVVVGAGLDALREVHAVLVDDKKPRQTVPQDSEICLVFFSYEFGRYVHLQKVVRRGSTIELQYRFVPHKTKELTYHLALIPVGKLRSGEEKVEVSQLPMERELVKAHWEPIAPDVARRIVCNSFSFVVK